MNQIRQPRFHTEDLARLHAELATRLRPACTEMPAEEFDSLVREIARVKVKYDLPAAERL